MISLTSIYISSFHPHAPPFSPKSSSSGENRDLFVFFSFLATFHKLLNCFPFCSETRACFLWGFKFFFSSFFFSSFDQNSQQREDSGQGGAAGERGFRTKGKICLLLVDGGKGRGWYNKKGNENTY